MFRKINDTISESNDIHDILKLISYDTWLLLDIDNTVMQSSLELGSDQWFGKLIAHASLLMPTQEEAVASVLAIYHSVQHHIKSKHVEPKIAKTISTLQDIGVPVIALTSRDDCLMETTVRQLLDVGIDFSRHNMHGDAKDRIELGTQKGKKIIFCQNMIFCSGHNKGASLKSYLEKCGHSPKHIIMVDDKLNNLTDVKEAVESLRIKYHGLRYGYLDTEIAKINMEEAHIQLAFLKPKLPPLTQQYIDQLKIVPVDAPIRNLNHINFFHADSAGSAHRAHRNASSNKKRFIDNKSSKSDDELTSPYKKRKRF